MSTDRLKLEVLLTAIDKVTGPLKTMAKGSGEAARALRAAKDQLRSLEDQQKNIAAFKDADRAAAITANAFKGVQERVRLLKEEMAKTPEPTQKMVRALKDAQKESDDLKRRHEGLMSKQQRLFQQMKEGGIDVRKLADHSRDLATRQIAAAKSVETLDAALKAQNKTLARMHAARAQYEKSMATASKLRGAGGSAMMAGAAVNAAAAVPVLAYAKAEDSATQLKISMMKAGGVVSKEFGEINDLANRLGNKLPGTTSDFQDMMTMLVRQGMPAKNILGGLGEATALLAVQLKMAPTAAAEFASKLQDATRATDKEMMGLMDTIQRTFYLGVDSNNMLEAFKGLGPVMDMIKQKGLEGTNALTPFVVMMDQAGMRGESAGNAIRKVVNKSLDVDKIKRVTDDLMKEKGIKLKLDFTNGKGEYGGIDKMMGELAKLKRFDTVQRIAILKDLYGDDNETNQVLSKIIEKGMDGYRDVQAKMAAQASLQERVTAQLGTLKNLWDAASGTFTNLLVTLGESIAPELHATAEWMGKLAERAQTWAKANPELSGTLMTVMKWAGLLTVGAGALLVAIGSLAVPIAATSFVLAAFGTTAGGAALATWAFLAPLAKLAAAFAVGWAAGSLFGELIDWLLSKMLGYETTLGASLYDLVQLVSELPGKFMTAGGQMIDGLITGIQQRWQALKDTVGNVADSTVGWLKDKLGIRSPSRIFAEIGGYTMAGLEQGILGGQSGALGALTAAARRLTAAGAGLLIGGGAAFAGDMPHIDSRPPLAPPALMAQASGPMIVQITINAAPGMDEQAIARQVASELQRIEAQRAARGRSRLRDTE